MTVDGSVAKIFVLWMQLLPTNTKSAKTMAAKAILCQFINITDLLVESFGLQILTIHHSLLAIRHSLPFSRKAIGATSAQTDGDFRAIVATLDATTIVAGRTNARHNFRERVSTVEAFPFVTRTANPCHPISKRSPTQNTLRRCHPSSPPALIVFHRVCSRRTAIRYSLPFFQSPVANHQSLPFSPVANR
jgi:hypothetical protein